MLFFVPFYYDISIVQKKIGEFLDEFSVRDLFQKKKSFKEKNVYGTCTCDPLNHLGSNWYHSEPIEVPLNKKRYWPKTMYQLYSIKK